MSTSWQNRITRYGEEPPDQLLAHPLNFRMHPKHQQDALAGVLGEVGIVQNVIVNERTGHVVDGHLRISLALRQNQPTVPVTYVDLSESEEALILATLDPISALATADADKLRDLLEDVSTGDAALMQMISDMAEREGIVDFGGTDLLTDPDDVPPVPDDPITQPGDLWLLGRNRLLCGDSTKAEDVARLMDGERADMVFTDPPYGIDRDHGFGGAVGFGGKGKPIARKQYKGNWDSGAPPKDCFDLMLALAPRALVFGGNFFTDSLPQSNHWIVWDKKNTMPTFGDAELVWTNIPRNSVKIKVFEYNGLIGKEGEREHATQKPLALLVDLLNDYGAEDDLVVDLFGGSGSTLIACEQTNRRCAMMELDPAYCDVIVRRWENATGQTATRETEAMAAD